ncbi:MAG: ABC transporter substrate-binding protein, partial [Candidatus Dormibacteraceae bacterium]
MLVVLVSVVLTCAACAGGNGGASSSSKTPIKIGLLTSLTGNYSPLGSQDELAAKQMVKEIDAKGGIGGRQITLDVKNDNSDPNQTVVALN